ncbi:MAG: RHS repeat protein, partial [Desulfobacterales bacterium]|nr:RHS repeat protein [Desulfobacterales bacterium]
EIPPPNQDWTSVNVNGTTFKKHGGYWTPERGRHGSLVEQDGAFIYTTKDGIRHRYDYPLRLMDDALLRASAPQPSPLRTIIDRNGNTTSFHYDDKERLERVMDAVGRELTLHYGSTPGPGGPEDRLVRVTGPDGIELQFSYNEQGLLEIVGRSDRVETYEYALQPGGEIARYNLVKTIDSNGAEHAYTYAEQDEIDFKSLANVKALRPETMVKSVVNPDGGVVEIAYETTTENKRVVTDMRRNPTVYTLNYYGNPRTIEEPESKIIRMVWSIDEGLDDNVMLSKTDGRGFTTHFQYDWRGNVTLETDPPGNSIATRWDPAFSVPLERTDRNGVEQRWEYDAKGNLLVHTDGEGFQSVYEYWETGERRTATDPRQNTTTYTYDEWGNPATILGPEGSLTTFTNDIRGRRTSTISANGNKTEYFYDLLDYPT